MRNIPKDRVLIFFSILFALYFILLLRAVYLLQDKAEPTSTISNKIQNKFVRPDILDRNGEILATNLITYTLYAEPANIRSAEEILRDLQQYLGNRDQVKLLKKLSNKNSKRRILLIRDLTPQEKHEINSFGHVGLHFHEDLKRFYPYKNGLAHILGFVDHDEIGLAGFEKYYDRVIAKERTGQQQVNLALNINVQNIVHETLKDAVQEFSALGGGAVVLDVASGEIYAFSSFPDFNPYNPGATLVDKNYHNKVSYELYEMGSTFKIFTMALALENQLINLEDEIDVSDDIRIDGFNIKDFKKIKEEITFRKVFAKSSNIGTARIAQKFPAGLQQKFLKDLKFFQPLNIELVERSFAKMPKRWGLSRTITASYGYGVSVSAIHLAQAVAAMVNGGYLVDATLLKKEQQDLDRQNIISEQTSKKVRELMAEVVASGTGWRANSKGYSVGGKTGSAHKVGKKGYDEDRLLSSFVGVFPIEEPQFLVYLFLDEPKGTEQTGGYATGGVVAAPYVKKIIERIAPLLNIAPDKDS